MSLIKCTECGKEISDKATSCPNCGCPIENVDYNVPDYLKNNNTIYPQRNSSLSVVALVLAILGCTIPVAIILAVVDLIKNKKDEKHALSIISIVICVFWFLIIGGSGSSNNIDIENNSPTQFTNNEIKYNETKETTNTNEQTEETQKEEIKKIDVSVKEELIYDKKDVKIYIKSIKEEPTKYLLNFQIENNSSLNLGFNAHAYSINKIMTNNNIYEMDYNVSSKKKTVAQLEIEKSLMEELGVEQLKNIDILIWAYDNDKLFKEFDTGQITIKTNLDDGKYNYFSGQNIYKKEKIKIDYIGNKNNQYTFFLKNNTGNYFSFDVENITINDCTSSDTNFDLISIITLDKCGSLFTIEPSEEFMDLNSIEEINSIEFTLEIEPLEDVFEAYNTEIIRLEF